MTEKLTYNMYIRALGKVSQESGLTSPGEMRAVTCSNDFYGNGDSSSWAEKLWRLPACL